jgi:ABC-type branched-subunit amino acid transport system substrate-binding protein
MNFRRSAGALVVLATASLVVSTGASIAGAQSPSARSTQAGTPIRLYTIMDTGSQGDDYFDGITAAIARINQGGGIKLKDGTKRKVAMTKCDDQRTAAGAQACARKVTADSSTVAVVGSENTQGAAIMPILEAAGIPYIGATNLAAEATSKVTFDATMANGSTIARAILVAKSAKAKSVVIPYNDSGAALSLVSILQPYLTQNGSTLAAKVPVPTLGATDVTAQVTAVETAKPDAILPILSQAATDAMLKTQVSLGYFDTPWVIGAANANPLQVSALYPKLKFYVVGQLNEASAGWKAFLKDMKKYAVKGSALSEGPALGWNAVNIFQAAAEKADAVTASGILATMATLKYDSQGLTPLLDFSKAGTITVNSGQMTRIINTTYYPYEIKNGKLVSLNGNKPVQIFS